MSSYIAFDEKEVCLNCPMQRCVLEGRKSGKCQIIREKREEHRREQREKRKKSCKNFSRLET